MVLAGKHRVSFTTCLGYALACFNKNFSALTARQQYYVRSTRFVLPTLYDALGKGNDPDRMKGALYVLWNKGIGEQGSNVMVQC